MDLFLRILPALAVCGVILFLVWRKVFYIKKYPDEESKKRAHRITKALTFLFAVVFVVCVIGLFSLNEISRSATKVSTPTPSEEN